jgi:hypothetical protein
MFTFSNDVQRFLTDRGLNPNHRPIQDQPFTIVELHRAFAKVRNETDWKLPISATIRENELSVVAWAIIFFTDGPLSEVTHLEGSQVRIYANGYYFYSRKNKEPQRQRTSEAL